MADLLETRRRKRRMSAGRWRRAAVAAGLVVSLARVLGAEQQSAPRPPEQTDTRAGDPELHVKPSEILQNAEDTASAAQPQVRAAAFFRMARAYQTFDTKKALELYRLAFHLSNVLSDELRENLHRQIVAAVASLSLPEAIELLRQMRPIPGYVVRNIVIAMTGDDQFDAAAGIVESAAAGGVYPFEAVETMLDRLPPDDPRRAALFSSAVAGYSLHPDDEDGNLNRAFADLLVRHYQEIPRGIARQALDAVIKSALEREEGDEPLGETAHTPRGTVTFRSAGDVMLFKVLSVAQVIDPKRVQEILEKRPELRQPFERILESPAAVEKTERAAAENGATDPPPAEDRRDGLDRSVQAAMKELDQGRPGRALDLAKRIEKEAARAQALRAIADWASGQRPESAAIVVRLCMSVLEEIRNPQIRVGAWDAMAQAAYNSGDRQAAWEALMQGVEDASSLYKLDSDKDSPNLAPVEYWPSTQAYRQIVSVSAKLFGADALALLMGIQSPDLALLAQVEIASTLLGVPSLASSTLSKHARKMN